MMYKDLSTAQYVFLIMQDDLHYDDESIATALDVKPPPFALCAQGLKGGRGNYGKERKKNGKTENRMPRVTVLN